MKFLIQFQCYKKPNNHNAPVAKTLDWQAESQGFSGIMRKISDWQPKYLVPLLEVMLPLRVIKVKQG